jgi:uncharacterized protein YdaU (DUF1376 family)
MSGAVFVRFYATDWRAGCFGLSLEQEGLYMRVCAYIYETGKRLPLDDSRAAKVMGCHTNAYRKVRDQLASLSKIVKCDDGWTVKRVELELTKAQNGQANVGASRGSVRAPFEVGSVADQGDKPALPDAVTASNTPPDTRGVSVNTHRDTPPDTPPDTRGVFSKKPNDSYARSNNQKLITKEPPTPKGEVTDAQIKMKNALVPKDDHPSVAYADGKVTLFNGTRAEWLGLFEGDEKRLDLALIEVAGSIQTYGNRSIAVQVNAKLANIVARKRDGDKRYKAAVDSKSMPSAITPKLNIWWHDKAKVAAITPDDWRRRITELGDGQWKETTLGPDPSHRDCVVPDAIRREMRLSDKFDHNGLRVRPYEGRANR